MGGRRTETCVAPRHVDASRDFVLLSPNEQRGGERCQTLYFVLFSLLRRPRAGLAKHREIKSSFFGLATKNTMNNVRNRVSGQ